MESGDIAKNCLIIDARERHVIRHMGEFAGVPTIIKQITIGDYAIADKDGKITAIFERKSLEDAGASMKDGRWGNREKLLELSRETGCKIFFIIEGLKRDGYNYRETLCGRIPYSHIESSLFHMMMRDNIMTLWTKDTIDTARTLAAFMKSMNSLQIVQPKIAPGQIDVVNVAANNEIAKVTNFGKIGKKVRRGKKAQDEQLVDTREVQNVAQESPKVAQIEQQVQNDKNNQIDILSAIVTNTAATVETPPALTEDLKSGANEAIKRLTVKHEVRDIDVLRELWSTFPGITTVNADEYAAKFHLVQVLTHNPVTVEQIGKLKHSNGRKVSRKTIAGLLDIGTVVQIRLLSKIPGISRDAAAKLVQLAGGLDKLIQLEPAAIAEMYVGAKKFGLKKAQMVKKYFTMKLES